MEGRGACIRADGRAGHWVRHDAWQQQRTLISPPLPHLHMQINNTGIFQALAALSSWPLMGMRWLLPVQLASVALMAGRLQGMCRVSGRAASGEAGPVASVFTCCISMPGPASVPAPPQIALARDEGAPRLFAAATWLLRQASACLAPPQWVALQPCGTAAACHASLHAHSPASSLLPILLRPLHMLQMFSVVDAGPLWARSSRALQEVECLQVCAFFLQVCLAAWARGVCGVRAGQSAASGAGPAAGSTAAAAASPRFCPSPTPLPPHLPLSPPPPTQVNLWWLCCCSAAAAYASWMREQRARERYARRLGRAGAAELRRMLERHPMYSHRRPALLVAVELYAMAAILWEALCTLLPLLLRDVAPPAGGSGLAPGLGGTLARPPPRHGGEL